MAEAHNHHFVPQGYLRRFADGIGRKARVYVSDRETGKSFTTLVRNIGALRDFNRIEAEGYDPNFLEGEFAKLEGPACEAIGRIIETRSFADTADRELVLSLIALLAARNPRNRETFGQFQVNIAERLMEMMVSTKERWEDIQRQYGAEHPEREPSDITYEEMKKFVDGGEYTIKVDQTHQLGLEVNLWQPVYELLSKRKWTLHFASDDARDFVTSDHPVVLLPVGWHPGAYGIGYGLAKTVVIFTIGRRAMLTGMFEGDEVVRTASPLEVAVHNSHIIQAAERQVYSFDSQFGYITSDKREALGEVLSKDPKFALRSVSTGKKTKMREGTAGQTLS